MKSHPSPPPDLLTHTHSLYLSILFHAGQAHKGPKMLKSCHASDNMGVRLSLGQQAPQNYIEESSYCMTLLRVVPKFDKSSTVCPRSSVLFYIVNYHIKWCQDKFYTDISQTGPFLDRHILDRTYPEQDISSTGHILNRTYPEQDISWTRTYPRHGHISDRDISQTNVSFQFGILYNLH